MRKNPTGQSRVLEITGSDNNEMNQLPTANEPLNISGASFSRLTSTHIVCFFIGLFLCGIPLLVIVMLSFNPSVTGSTVPPTIVLPTQCFTYTTADDSTRLHTHQSCCGSDQNLATGWYRFTGNGGTRLITTQLSTTNICGTYYPGWWNGTLPMTAGTTNVGNMCFYNGGSSCTNPLSPISATNCSGYYVFYLLSIPCCTPYRYCTTS